MIDPFTALAIAQSAVTGIKKAVALGKDVKSLITEFSSFYEHADHVHIASARLKVANLSRTDSQIRGDALKIALASKLLRDNERELKDLLFWSGNADVWQDMMAERVRMAKERAALEAHAAEIKQKKKEAMADVFWSFMIFIGATALLVPVISVVFHLTTRN